MPHFDMTPGRKGLVRQLELLWQRIEALQSGGGSGEPIQGPKGDKGDKGDPGEQGPPGVDGSPGADGQSGAQGVPGARGEAGPKGDTGNDGNDGAAGSDGDDGQSAYQVAVANGYAGTQAQWLASLVGAKGDKGDRGDTGLTGQTGQAGTNGSDGNDGAPGPTAYQVAVANGFVGNEAAWLLSLKGAKGDTGNQGLPGADGVRTGTTVFGYAVGAGGTAAQSGNKSTAVTLNKLTGEITMVNSALAAAAIVTFTLNNNQVAAGDMLHAVHQSGGTVGPYLITPRVTGAGVCTITVRNTSAASLSEAIIIKFAVIKAATS